MLLYVAIAGLIQFALQLVQICDLATSGNTYRKARQRYIFSIALFFGGKNAITKLPPCLTFGVIQGVKTLSETLQRKDYPKISNFDSLAKRTLFYCSIYQSLCAFAHKRLRNVFFFFFFFCFFNSGCFIAILPCRLAAQSSHSVCWHIFQYIGSIVQWCLKQSALCHTDWSLRWIRPP